MEGDGLVRPWARTQGGELESGRAGPPSPPLSTSLCGVSWFVTLVPAPPPPTPSMVWGSGLTSTVGPN